MPVPVAARPLVQSHPALRVPCCCRRPTTTQISNPQKQLIDPAVLGTTNVLNSVNKADGGRRVVVTSSCAAIYGCNDDKPLEEQPYTEEDWNTSSTLSVSAHWEPGAEAPKLVAAVRRRS